MATHSRTPAEESHRQRRLGSRSPQGLKELDTTEATQHALIVNNALTAAESRSNWSVAKLKAVRPVRRMLQCNSQTLC